MTFLSGVRSRVRTAGLALIALATLLASCGRPAAMGEADSLIVVADEALWSEVEQETYDAIETTLFTIRDEKKFYITHVAPASNELDQLLLWKQVVVFGIPGDPLIDQVAEAAGRETLNPPEIFQTPNVWAGGQAVTAVVLEPGREAASWRASLSELHELLDRQYRLWALNRMWISGEDTTLTRQLEQQLGFTLRVPAVYGYQFRDDDLVVIRNDNPDPSDLIRSLLVQRRPRTDSLDAATILDWRAGIDSVEYAVPQSFEAAPGPGQPIEVDGVRGLEVRGAWRDEGDYPAGGPFFARALTCPDATFFIDAWLYSPNPRRSKWQYIMQMEEILGSFACRGN
ncbi:MAG: DUF4837 family protein [marine benthic group bacterium]|jgi:hypothetical protein|nr:DUF4837 family protein [Gemmatimonadota bacterium]